MCDLWQHGQDYEWFIALMYSISGTHAQARTHGSLMDPHVLFLCILNWEWKQCKSTKVSCLIIDYSTACVCFCTCVYVSTMMCLRWRAMKHSLFSPLLSLVQREAEAPGQRGQSHPVQLARQEVHSHRGAQDQPITARLHQEPLRLHPGCAWQLEWTSGEWEPWDDDCPTGFLQSCW